MRKNLRDYLLSRLVPAGIKLELVNRLENLCSLSGQPMSPELQNWMTRTFGLEMTRTVQDYATFNPNRLSPELQTKIDRILPANQRLDFKSLFDVSCAPPPPPPPINFWSAVLFDNASPVGFQPGTSGDWTLVLNSVTYPVSDWDTMMGTIGGQAYNFSTIGKTLNGYLFTYFADSPISPLQGFNGNGNPIQTNPWNWRGFQTFCFTGTWSPSPPMTVFNRFSGIPGSNVDLTPLSISVDPNDPATQPALQSFLQSTSGPNATVSYVDNGGGVYQMTINNVYNFGSAPLFGNSNFSTVLIPSSIPCP